MARPQRKTWIIAGLAVVLAGGGTYVYLQQKPKSAAAVKQEKTTEVKKGELRSTVSGTSQFEARDLQNIIAPADGTIKTLNLTRNQAVKQGDVLVVVSDPELDTNLSDARSTLSTLQSDLADLQEQQGSMTITAPVAGEITLSSNIDAGGSVNKSGRVATITDTSVLKVKLPFLVDDALQLKKGDEVELEADGFSLSRTGKVLSVSKQVRGDAAGNKLVDVEVEIRNDGTLDEGMNVEGSVLLGGREAESTAKAALSYDNVEPVFAGAGGTIRDLKVKTGDTVTKGAVLAVLGSDTLADDIKDKQKAIEKQQSQIALLEERIAKLTLTAPFDGVFSTDFADKKKNVLASYPVGSTIEANTVLGGVASLDTMQLPIQVDELDLPNVKVGQKAEVTVDSITGKVFEGEVSQVSTVGTTTNGVTFFDVVITVKNSGELRNGLTATAEILVQDKKDIITLPVEALQRAKGKRTVSVLQADGTKEQREVKTGISNKTSIEITEGLQEGEKVVIPVRQTTTNGSQADIERIRQMMQQGGGAGGFPGGGAGGFPGGGQGGGTGGQR
ncbi:MULTISPECIES: efflux RND transporter periplasmic adaptor subunit [Paenibacillus]|uniref:efflux RND transporter periplasmic adaptor subunit n=1 Tax=Paenibacillus TaxID=44249 RepID=UPI0022B8F86F|nr:efflux RND transporter periplasmic adaptor subunit [Paenibacillus caseinilyticus]MCZ8520710.1 efflux RND transporter periplasmic adaptor subunit [Paenibacillus caseinilyticus]